MALLNKTGFLAELPVSVNIAYDRLLPDVRRAGLKYIRPILGKDLYSTLEAAYEAETMTADEAALHAYVAPALAHLAAWMYIPKANVQHSNQGVQAVHSGDSKPAFEWQVKDYSDSLLGNGFDALDELVDYLEMVADTDFADWLSSEACTLVRSNVINSAQVFTEHVTKLRNSGYLFTYVRPIMSRIEKMILPAVMGAELYDELKTQIKSDSVSALNLAILGYAQAAVAHQTWADTMIELNFSTDGEGVFLLNNSFTGTVKAKAAAEKERIASIRNYHMEISRDNLKRLGDYLVANVADYPLYEASGVYDVDDTDPSFEHGDDWGVVVFGL